MDANERLQYSVVKESFDKFLMPKRNVMYERARFNQTLQQVTEPVNLFVTSLYARAESCNYGPLHDELIRDRLVVGLRDTTLSEIMSLDKDVNLAKAISMAKQSEKIKRQQTDIRGDVNSAVDAVMANKHKQSYKANPSAQARPATQQIMPDQRICPTRGKWSTHTRWRLPAKEVTWHTGGERGHFSKVCKLAKAVDAATKDNGLIIGIVGVGKDPWSVEIQIRNVNVKFKIDTGADVTVIPENVYKGIYRGVQ